MLKINNVIFCDLAQWSISNPALNRISYQITTQKKTFPMFTSNQQARQVPKLLSL